MPDPLESIVQRMMDAGESEENIANVIRQYNTDNPPVPKKPGPLSPYSGPTDFWGGFTQSLLGGEAAKAGAQGALGFAKGATIDIPASIIGGLGQLGGAIAHPIETATNLPSNIANMASGMWETTQQAGSNPEAFGRMMGQVTGQPLVTAGLAKAAPVVVPPAIQAAGRPVAGVGNLMAKYQPMSGMMPRFADIRTLRNLEAATGRGLSRLGERMKQVAPPVRQGEVLPPDWPPESMAGAQYTEVPPTAIPAPESPGTFYQGEAAPTPPAPPPYYPPSQPLALPPAQSISAPGDIPATFGMEGQSPIVGQPPVPTPSPPPPAPPPQLALPPASSIQLPGDIPPTFGMEPQAPVVGRAPSTPQPHNIPPAAAPVTPKPTGTQMLIEKRNVNPQTLKYLKDKGLEFAGFDAKGNLIFSDANAMRAMTRKP
jgi:hypothetical protein